MAATLDLRPRGSMVFLARLAQLAALLAIVDATIGVVLAFNMSGGVYPVHADAIGIPLVTAAMHSLVAAALLLAAASMSGLLAFCRRARVPNAFRRIAAWLAGLSHLAAATFFFLWGLSWALPDHYWIFGVATLAGLCVVYLAMSDLRLRRHPLARSRSTGDHTP